MENVTPRDLAAMAEVDGDVNPFRSGSPTTPITADEREPFERVCRLNRVIAQGHHRSDPIDRDIVAKIEAHRQSRKARLDGTKPTFWTKLASLFSGPAPALASFLLGAAVAFLALQSEQLMNAAPETTSLVAGDYRDAVQKFRQSAVETDSEFSRRATGASSDTAVPNWVSAYVRQNPDSDVARFFSGEPLRGDGVPGAADTLKEALSSLADETYADRLVELPSGEIVIQVGEDTDGCVLYKTSSREGLEGSITRGPFQQQSNSSPATPGFYGAMTRNTVSDVQRFCLQAEHQSSN